MSLDLNQPDLFASFAPSLYGFLLVLVRLSGLFLADPFLGSSFFPGRVKVAAALVLGAVLALGGLVAPTGTSVPRDVLTLGLVVVREIGVGAALGLMVRLLVAAATMAGHLVGVQMGLAAATVLDPQGPDHVSTLGEATGLLAVALFLVADGHHMVLVALHRSFVLAPPGVLRLGGGVVGGLMDAGAGLFTASLQMAAPALAAVFLANVGLAIVARTVPPMNVFAVGFIVTLAVGLLLLVLTAPALAEAIRRHAAGLMDALVVLVRAV